MRRSRRMTLLTRVTWKRATCWSVLGICWIILTSGAPKERAEVVADMQKDNRLGLMEARNRQIKEDAHGQD